MHVARTGIRHRIQRYRQRSRHYRSVPLPSHVRYGTQKVSSLGLIEQIWTGTLVITIRVRYRPCNKVNPGSV